MAVPEHPKIYHIVHIDKLRSIIGTDGLLSDAAMVNRAGAGTTIGMDHIKARRLGELTLHCHPGLHVGECVPFYFCSRSVMLYLIHKRNPDLAYQDGQLPIVHLEADFHAAVDWARTAGKRWAFTLSNAGARYFEDRCDIAQLDEVNWDAVHARNWSGPLKEGKQAEFLVESAFPWHLVERIGVYSNGWARQVADVIDQAKHRPRVEIKPDWYY